jgi:hypothetical protein
LLANEHALWKATRRSFSSINSTIGYSFTLIHSSFVLCVLTVLITFFRLSLLSGTNWRPSFSINISFTHSFISLLLSDTTDSRSETELALWNEMAAAAYARIVVATYALALLNTVGSLLALPCLFLSLPLIARRCHNVRAGVAKHRSSYSPHSVLSALSFDVHAPAFPIIEGLINSLFALRFLFYRQPLHRRRRGGGGFDS